MKKSVEIPVHIIFWTMFTVLTFVLSKMYLESVPDAPFAAHFTYVVLLELVMGLVFFYTTFFMMPWAQKKQNNALTLAAILFVLLIVFALPAIQIGVLEVLSSVVPHLLLILLGVLFFNAFKTE
jgi:hypothetical protein